MRTLLKTSQCCTITENKIKKYKRDITFVIVTNWQRFGCILLHCFVFISIIKQTFFTVYAVSESSLEIHHELLSS